MGEAKRERERMGSKAYDELKSQKLETLVLPTGKNRPHKHIGHGVQLAVRRMQESKAK